MLEQADAIKEAEDDVIAVSAVSCWEVAKLVERGRLTLPCVLDAWLRPALGYPGVRSIELSPKTAVASTQLPGAFHRDPADQIIAATARVNGCPVVTSDDKIISEHVETLPEKAAKP